MLPDDPPGHRSVDDTNMHFQGIPICMGYLQILQKISLAFQVETAASSSKKYDIVDKEFVQLGFYIIMPCSWLVKLPSSTHCCASKEADRSILCQGTGEEATGVLSQTLKAIFLWSCWKKFWIIYSLIAGLNKS